MKRRREGESWRWAGGATWRLALTTLAALLVLATLGSPAAAHTTLDSSTPKDGATVRSLKTITLRFAGPVSGGADSLVVTTADDEPVRLTTKVTDDTLTAELREGQPEPGRYLATYRVRSADGDSVTGRLAFKVSGPARAQPSRTSEPPPATGTATPSPTPTPSLTAAPASPSAAPAENAAAEAENSTGTLVLGLALAVAALAAVGYVIASRRRGRA